MRGGDQQSNSYPTDEALGRVLNVLHARPDTTYWEYRLATLCERVVTFVWPGNDQLRDWTYDRQQAAEQREIYSFRARYQAQSPNNTISLDDTPPAELARVVHYLDRYLLDQYRRDVFGKPLPRTPEEVRNVSGLDAHRARIAKQAIRWSIEAEQIPDIAESPTGPIHLLN